LTAGARRVGRRIILLGEPIGRVRTFGFEGVGAKVDDVPLGLRAFGVVTADGAALGFMALGFGVSEAAALGFVELGPTAAGAEPGVGTKTP